ncbi:MAG: hypothetical protein HQL50_00620 [Magnetococcales bacterium]|nr:hypothetical protein [Magnetococcales bacterium]
MIQFIILTIIMVAVWAMIRFVYAPFHRRFRVRRSMGRCASVYALPPLSNRLDKSRIVSSRVKAHRRYRVNLYRQVCTCTSYRKRRQYYPVNDVRRLCRHMRRELLENQELHSFDDLTMCILLKRAKDRCYEKIRLMETDIAIGYSPKTDFVRIYTRRRGEDDPDQGPFTGPYDKFVFNANQENWVYGEPPPGASMIIPAVLLLLSQTREKCGITETNERC